MEKPNKSINELFLCKCLNTEHQLIFQYFPDDKEVFVSVHLNPEHRLLKRIWVAIKYIFGYRCKYGHFDEFIFNGYDAERLQKVVDVLKD